MSTEIPRSAGPAGAMAPLTRTPADVERRSGRRAALDLDRAVAAAVRLADAEGLAALSMRRLAGELGVAVMSLYGHVPGKGALHDLMLDTVLAELYVDGIPAGNWRARVEAMARANWQFFRRHPWAAQLAGGSPPPGPHLLRKQEIELHAVDGLGLSPDEMDLLVTLVDGFVRGTVPGAPVRAAVESGPVDPERFPTTARIRAATARPAAENPDRSFEFGLERLLDGIGVLILSASR